MSQHAFYVTTPIYYISGNPHIGHAYTTIAADVLARTARAQGPAFMLTGTDEHGQKVANAAAAAGKTPLEWCDELVPKWKAISSTYGVHYDDFIRTTEPRHVEACQKVFEKLKASGDAYLGKYEGWYCTNDETFWPQAKLIEGRCPNPECRRPVEWLSEDNWFFRLSAYRERLIAFYKERPEWLRPQAVYNEMMAVLEGGLDDLSISRETFDWGVPLGDGRVMYVWLDALLNYITALGWASDAPKFQTYWPADVQLVGKDIARFHTIIWPAVLWALGLPAPDRVYAHGWLTVEGEKMSKSKGNVVDPFELAAAFGPDTVRFFLLREAHFGSDFSMSEEKIRQRHNNDLGNDLGNLLNRTLAMLKRYRAGRVPEYKRSSYAERYGDLPEKARKLIMALQFRDALEAIWELVSALNREIDDQKPWDLNKQGNNAELDALLYDLCEGLRWIALMTFPFMPQKAQEIWDQLGLRETPSRPWKEALVWGTFPPGTLTAPGPVLFARIDENLEAPA